MALPETVRVKLSSEDAGAIALTPVVSREYAFEELLNHLLDAAGKDLKRLLELLERGVLVVGGTRLRWAGLKVSAAELSERLSLLPDPEPERAFDAARCEVVVRGRLEYRRERAERRSLWDRLRGRPSEWDKLLALAKAGPLVYAGYSYERRADRYRLKEWEFYATRLP